MGPPIELGILERERLLASRYLRFEEDDVYLRRLARTWNRHLMAALRNLADIEWGGQRGRGGAGVTRRPA